MVVLSAKPEMDMDYRKPFRFFVIFLLTSLSFYYASSRLELLWSVITFAVAALTLICSATCLAHTFYLLDLETRDVGYHLKMQGRLHVSSH